MSATRAATMVAVVLATAVATGSGLASNFSTPPIPLQIAFVIIAVIVATGLAARAELTQCSQKRRNIDETDQM